MSSSIGAWHNRRIFYGKLSKWNLTTIFVEPLKQNEWDLQLDLLNLDWLWVLAFCATHNATVVGEIRWGGGFFSAGLYYALPISAHYQYKYRVRDTYQGHRYRLSFPLVWIVYSGAVWMLSLLKINGEKVLDFSKQRGKWYPALKAILANLSFHA